MSKTVRATKAWRRLLPWGITVVVAMTSGGIAKQVHAAEVNYFYGYRAEFSDNIRRVSTGRENEMVNVLLGGMVYQETTPRLDLRLAPTIEYLNYKRNIFDDEARLTLDSLAVWRLSPQRLNWTLEDTARQVRVDPTRPDTPANTVLANLLNTGPDLYLRFSPLNTLQFGARYLNVYIEDTDLDNERSYLYSRWLYQYSPITAVSLNLERQDVRFEDELVTPNFERRDAYFRLQTQQARSTVIVDLGGTRIKPDGADEIDGSLARFTWRRQSTTESSFGLLAESGFSDTGTDLAATAAAVDFSAGVQPVQSVSQNLVAQDIFRAKRIDIFFNRYGTEFSSELRLFARDLEFQTTPLDDRDEYGANVALTYLYSAASSFGIYGERERIEYRNQVLIDTDTTLGLRLLRLISRDVSVTFELQREERASTDSSREFVEDRLLFGVVYNSGPIQRGQ